MLAYVALLCAGTAAAHTLTVAYNTSGAVSVFPFGSFALIFDSTPVIAAGFPHVEGWVYGNGSQPNFNYARDALNRTFDLATATYLNTYKWGSLQVAHIQSSALALDFVITLTNGMAEAMGGGFFGVHGDEVYWAPNASDFIPPHAITGFGFVCSGCWPPFCGNYLQCDPSHAQAVPIDFQSGAAAWVRVDAPPPLPGPIAPSDPAWLSPGILSPDKLVAGARYTLSAVLHGVLPPGASTQARFSLRFGDGSGLKPAPFNPAGPLSLVADIYAAFGKARPMTTPVLAPRGPIGALFGSTCGASCTCKSWSPQDCPNPRGWDTSIGQHINTTSAEGVAAFQDLARAWVNKSVHYCTQVLGPGPAACAGILFWSIEGSQFYQPDPVYIGSPDMLPILAPEMDEIADELMQRVTGAGLRLGFTLRPQKLTQSPGWNASQPPWFQPQRWHQHDFLNPDNSTDAQGYAQNLIDKVSYAKSRWGVRIWQSACAGLCPPASRPLPNALAPPPSPPTPLFPPGIYVLRGHYGERKWGPALWRVGCPGKGAPGLHLFPRGERAKLL